MQKRINQASAAIGEKIDLDRDTPEELERKADKRQHAEPKTERPKHRERAPQEVVDGGEFDGGIEEVWKALSALDWNAQAKIMLRARRSHGWGLRMGPRWRVPAAHAEPAVALPPKAAPATYDTAVDSQPEQQEDGADVSADDLQHPGDAVFQAADQEPELAVDKPAKIAPATGDAAHAADLGAEDLQDADEDVPEGADQEPNGANLDAEHLQDAAVDISEAADQEPADATKCAYCSQPFSSIDPAVMKDGRLVRRNKCVGWVKPIAIAAE